LKRVRRARRPGHGENCIHTSVRNEVSTGVRL
jgi:hypothetical protein